MGRGKKKKEKRTRKRSSITFFVFGDSFGHFFVTFWSLFLMLPSLFSSLFCQTPFAGRLLRQGDDSLLRRESSRGMEWLGGPGIAFFRALKFQISEPEIWKKNRSLCGISGIFLEISASEKNFPDSGKWPFHMPPIYTSTKCRPITTNKEKNGPVFRKVYVFDVSQAVGIARFESVSESQPHRTMQCQ